MPISIVLQIFKFLAAFVPEFIAKFNKSLNDVAAILDFRINGFWSTDVWPIVIAIISENFVKKYLVRKILEQKMYFVIFAGICLFGAILG